jgi:endonuclease/exonuclease/phosphatase (EEP) superfamily protein YafD
LRGLRSATTVLAWAGTLLAIAGLTARYVDLPVQWSVVLAASTPLTLVVASISSVAFVVIRRWESSIVAVLTAASLAAVQVPLFISTDAVGSMHQPITVLQANIAVGQADADSVVSVVVEERVDILTVSELTVPALHRLQTAGLQAELPYWVLDPRGGGAGGGIWSRFPLSDYTAYPQFTHAAMSATATTSPGSAVRVTTVHPVAPWPEPTQTWSDELSMLAGMTGELTAFDGPVLIAGDLNATNDNAQFRDLLRDGLVDARRAAGAGLVPTFPADRTVPPFLAIDHVLVEGVRAEAVKAVDLPGSDHRGLLVILAIP